MMNGSYKLTVQTKITYNLKETCIVRAGQSVLLYIAGRSQYELYLIPS